MVRRTNIGYSIDGIIYDAQQRQKRGDSPATILSFMVGRMRNLKKWVEQEEHYNATAREKRHNYELVEE